MKVLVVTRDFKNYKKGDFFKDPQGKRFFESEKKSQLYASSYSQLKLMDLPVDYDAETFKVVHTQAEPEKWVKQGEQDQFSRPMRTFWEKGTDKVYTEPLVAAWEKDTEIVYTKPADLTGWTEIQVTDPDYTQGQEEDTSYTYVAAVQELWEILENAQLKQEKDDRIAQQQLDAAIEEDIGRGDAVEKLARRVLSYITGRNERLNVQANELDGLQQTFGNILALLQNNRPFSAKALIDAIDINTEPYVDQTMKDHIDRIFEKSGLQA